MAAETSTTISLQARDWEHIVGLSSNDVDGGNRRLISNLQAAYNVPTPPQGATLVPITTKERVLIRIFELFHRRSNNEAYLGSANLTRISAAIKAANTPADNYINTETARIEAQLIAERDATTTSNRKAGRQLLLVDVVDNN